MLNTQRGKRFESVLKRKLKDRGFKVLKLAIPETADLVLLNNKPIVIAIYFVVDKKVSIFV